LKQLFMQFLQVEHLQQSSRMSFSSAMHRPSTMTRAMVEKMMAQSPQPGGRGLHGQPSHRDRAPSILQPSGESCWFVRFKFGTRDYENFAQEVFFWKACTFFGVGPKKPFWCPHPDKKGTNLLLSQTGIHLHTHQDLKLKCCRVMGQKLRYGCPCTRDLPGTHN